MNDSAKLIARAEPREFPGFLLLVYMFGGAAEGWLCRYREPNSAADLESPARVGLELNNLRGEKIRTLVDDNEPAGIKQVTWCHALRFTFHELSPKFLPL